MSPILSVVAPVRDVQGALSGHLQRLFELLCDLTPQFEVLLIANQPTEQTEEIARDLGRSFPQLRFLRSTGVEGTPALAQVGLAAARGQLAFVVENIATVSPTDLRRLWQLRNDERLILARAEPARAELEPGFIRRLMQWGQKLRELHPSSDGVQLIRRDVVNELQQSARPDSQIVVEYVKDLQIARADSAHPEPPAARGLGFLQHLRELALGE